MPPKSLRISFAVEAEQLAEAIADLSNRFLRPTKTGYRVVRQPTDFPVINFCQALVDDWTSSRVAYDKGQITLSFSSGELTPEADLVIYKPQQGDRFLYSKRLDSAKHAQQLNIQGIAAVPVPHETVPHEIATEWVQSLHQALDILTELTDHQRSVESRLHGIDEQLNNQANQFAQLLAKQITATALHFNNRLDQLETQLTRLTTQLNEWIETPEDGTALPRSDAEWRDRFKTMWGTVGDYEQYSTSHRDATAETPLHDTPDWIALCELEWARKLSPTLATLHDLIHRRDGIGDEGANILHQFGKHIDPHSGEQYYIYRRSGFTAQEALWQTVRHPQNSWLPELRQIATQVAKRHVDVLQLFGWEPEAIASLETVVERAHREQHSSYNARPKPGNTLSDYLAVLNLGPFSPITIESIKRAYRHAMKTAHPDTGGSKELAQRVNEAYEAVLNHYFPKAT